MKNNLKNKKKKGFTLIELIIVIAIIAIIALIAIPRFGKVSQDAKLKSDIANAKTIANATSALIADGTIEVTAAINDIKLGTASPTGEQADIESYLQSVPTPETAGYENYEVDIDADGNVSVFMVGTGVTEKALYPGN